ncbi:MAG: methionyl-tRNA formyltransferase [Nitrospirota bacterium]|mgnify:CR=1 FL=1
MKIVYMGTPPFAVPPLQSLITAGHEVVGVVTRTDRPAGRGKVLTPPAVKVAAERSGLPVFQPKRVREPESVARIAAMRPDVIVVAAYGQILPREVLSLPRLQRGCVNIHASLLPAYRGAAPINWAIINGETRTGVTIMQMDEGMDTGAVLAQESIPIGPGDTAGGLTAKLSELGSRLLVDTLSRIEAGGLTAVPQDNSKATIAPLLKKDDGLVDWTMSAREIHNRVRGLSPWPGAHGYLDGKLIKVLGTEVIEGAGEPGALYEKDRDGLAIGTGSGLLRIVTIQPEGKKPMTAAEFLRGHRRIVGGKFCVRR